MCLEVSGGRRIAPSTSVLALIYKTAACGKTLFGLGLVLSNEAQLYNDYIDALHSMLVLMSWALVLMSDAPTSQVLLPPTHQLMYPMSASSGNLEMHVECPPGLLCRAEAGVAWFALSPRPSPWCPAQVAGLL